MAGLSETLALRAGLFRVTVDPTDVGAGAAIVGAGSVTALRPF